MVTRRGFTCDFWKKQVTVITDEQGNPWWVAKEVCQILGLENVTYALRSLGDDEKLKLTLSQVQRRGRGGDNGSRVVISESGLYKLIMRSDKPQAKAFQNWVTKEVLPQIRRTGGYIPVQQTPPEHPVESK